MIRIKRHVLVALIYFFLVALLGAGLRLFYVADVPANFRYLVHTHSHIALLGWVYIALSSMIYRLFLKDPGIDKIYRRIFWFTQVAILGMLLTFPFQGYALFSIIFSTLFLFATYLFSWMVLRFTPLEFRSRPSFWCLKAALLYLVISSIGPWALGGIMGTLGSTSVWYKLAIYFYLHFQYNAWFILALCSFLFRFLEQRNLQPQKENFRLFFYLVNASIILSFFLSVLWTEPGQLFYLLAGTGALLQLPAFYVLIRTLSPAWSQLNFSKFQDLLLKTAGGLLVLKILLQLLSAFPYFAQLAYRSPDLVIGYLHLTFLGVISIALFAFLNYLKLLRLPRIAFLLFMLGFLITESLLFYRGMAVWEGWPLFSDLYRWLLAGSCLFPLSIGWMLAVNLKKDQR